MVLRPECVMDLSLNIGWGLLYAVKTVFAEMRLLTQFKLFKNEIY